MASLPTPSVKLQIQGYMRSATVALEATANLVLGVRVAGDQVQPEVVHGFQSPRAAPAGCLLSDFSASSTVA